MNDQAVPHQKWVYYTMAANCPVLFKFTERVVFGGRVDILQTQTCLECPLRHIVQDVLPQPYEKEKETVQAKQFKSEYTTGLKGLCP